MEVLQTSSIPLVRSQQASTMPLQATTVPGTTAAQALDISSLMNLMITMMIMVMMIKMMSGAMEKV